MRNPQRVWRRFLDLDSIFVKHHGAENTEKIQKLKSTAIYEDRNSESGGCCFGLSFLEPDLIAVASPEVFPFSDYLFDTYVDVELHDRYAMFPKQM